MRQVEPNLQGPSDTVKPPQDRRVPLGGGPRSVRLAGTLALIRISYQSKGQRPASWGTRPTANLADGFVRAISLHRVLGALTSDRPEMDHGVNRDQSPEIFRMRGFSGSVPSAVTDRPCRSYDATDTTSNAHTNADRPLHAIPSTIAPAIRDRIAKERDPQIRRRDIAPYSVFF